jgi:hypothetical protein
MVELGVLEVGIINIAIILTVIINSIFMYFTLKIYTLYYLLLLLFCSIGAMITSIGILIVIFKLDVPINPGILTFIFWIFYTQSYLYFLTSYYKEFLKSWQTKTCYTINFINFINQIIFTIIFNFELGLKASKVSLISRITETISATSTVLSDTIITIYIFSVIFKLRRASEESKTKLMLIKVLLTMVLMLSLDVIIIYLEYRGDSFEYAYTTKPAIICIKFYIELLFLGICKKHLFIISSYDNW